MNLRSEMENLFDSIRLFAKTESLVGNPLVIGNISIIPILNISFGAGNGGSTGSDSKGSGAGAGGKISPIALVIIKDKDIRVISLKGQSNLQEITDLIPQTFSSSPEQDDNSAHS